MLYGSKETKNQKNSAISVEPTDVYFVEMVKRDTLPVCMSPAYFLTKTHEGTYNS